MKRFRVELCRNVTDQEVTFIEVDAQTQEQAMEKAIEIANSGDVELPEPKIYVGESDAWESDGVRELET